MKEYMISSGNDYNIFESREEAARTAKTWVNSLNPEILIYEVEEIGCCYEPLDPEPVIDWYNLN